MLPTGLRLASPNEMGDAYNSAPKGQPAVRGDTPGAGVSFNCPNCGDPVVRDMPSGYVIQINLKCGGCGSMLRLVY